MTDINDEEFKKLPYSKNCIDCKFCILQDTGYSNYTVCGTDFHCGLFAHPDAPFDEFYGEDRRLYFAETCSKYEAGDAINLDVDGENVDELEGEQKEIYENWLNKP